MAGLMLDWEWVRLYMRCVSARLTIYTCVSDGLRFQLHMLLLFHPVLRTVSSVISSFMYVSTPYTYTAPFFRFEVCLASVS